MTSPADQLLSAMETLLYSGREDYGIPATFGAASGIPIYRGDTPTELPTPNLGLSQAGACKERHVQGSGLWEVPVSARLVLDRNGALGETEAEIAASIRSYADDLEAVLTLKLRIDADDEDAGFSTPEQRLTNDDIHIWEIFDVEIEADNEMDGDPVCEVKFTAFCAHAGLIIPTA